LLGALKESLTRNLGVLGLATVIQSLQGRWLSLHAGHGALLPFILLSYASSLSLYFSIVKYINLSTNMVMLRTPRSFCRQTQAALTLMTILDGTPMSFRIIHVGGSILSTEKAVLQYDKSIVDALVGELRSAADSDDE